MRTVLSGTGTDTTATVAAFLAANNPLEIAELYEITTPQIPVSGRQFKAPVPFFLTSYGGPLKYSFVRDPGNSPAIFVPSVIKRESLNFELGTDASECKFTWSPINTQYTIPAIPGSVPQTLYQLFGQGIFDNGSIRVWKCFMPTPGDANTFGAAAYWMGRIAEVKVSSLAIEITAKDFRDLLEDQIPRYLIQTGNRTNQQGIVSNIAQYGVELVGVNVIGQGLTVAGSTRSTVKWTGPSGTLYADHLFAGCFAQLDDFLPALIQDSTNDGSHNFLYLSQPLPSVPTITQGIFIYNSQDPSDQTATNIGGQQLPGFPFVPRPEDQV